MIKTYSIETLYFLPIDRVAITISYVKVDMIKLWKLTNIDKI